MNQNIRMYVINHNIIFLLTFPIKAYTKKKTGKIPFSRRKKRKTLRSDIEKKERENFSRRKGKNDS